MTDEAPALATVSLLPILQAFSKSSGVKFESRDISLSSRILATFNDFLGSKIKYENDLEFLGKLVKDPNANIIKLPNISASIPQLKKAITELQSQGYNIPNYPEKVENDNDLIIKSIYDKIKGSAVNPVLREGNSDRRVPKAIKNYIKSNPHKLGKWSKDSRTHVSSMSRGDFRNNETSLTSDKHELLNIYHYNKNEKKSILKENITVHKKAIIDCSYMSISALEDFIDNQIRECKEKNMLLSLHLKASMMKVSDPIIFGHVLKVFFKNFIKNNNKVLDEINVDFNSGLSNIFEKLNQLDNVRREKLTSEIELDIENGPDIAMVNYEKNITNFHIPSDIIIDASMPAMIKSSGKMWDKNGELKDTKAIIPDSSYSSIYQATIDFCKENGQFDPAVMGTVQNVGLMAKKAEEYGSHDKTFEIKEDGKVCVETKDGKVLFTHNVMKGDIWRMCLVRNEAIKDWVKLAVERAKSTNYPTVFWLDENRSHDKQLLRVVQGELKKYDISDLNIQILSPYKATLFTLEKIKKGNDVISVSGNHIWPALLLTALACLLLGMEVPTTAAYVICVSVAGPALQELGLPLLITHLFIFWYALLSTITPPVCGTVFIAAGMVEETNWLKVAGYAMSLGVGLYLVPIGMVAQADIIHLLDKPFDATLAFIQLALSLAAISYGLISAVSLLPRFLLLAAGMTGLLV